MSDPELEHEIEAKNVRASHDPAVRQVAAYAIKNATSWECSTRHPDQFIDHMMKGYGIVSLDNIARTVDLAKSELMEEELQRMVNQDRQQRIWRASLDPQLEQIVSYILHGGHETKLIGMEYIPFLNQFAHSHCLTDDEVEQAWETCEIRLSEGKNGEA